MATIYTDSVDVCLSPRPYDDGLSFSFLLFLYVFSFTFSLEDKRALRIRRVWDIGTPP